MPDWGADGASVPFDIGSVTVSLSQLTGRVALAALLAAVALRIAHRVIGEVDDIRRRDQLRFFVPKVVALLATVAGLAGAGIDVTGMAAVMATIGFTGAVVFTPVGQNLVAGAMIRIDDVYRTGEAVTVAGLHGTVLYRSMLRTELALPDGSTAWVPNSVFQEHDVLNLSRMGAWRMSAEVPLERISDRTHAVEVMERTVAALEWTAPHRQPMVAVDHVAGDALVCCVYVWVIDPTEEPRYRGLLLGELVGALEREGIPVGRTSNVALHAST